MAGETTADVCVVGGGIAGLSVAEAASRRGLRVVVLEAASLGSGDTGVTTAHLSSALDEGYAELQRLHGTDGARLAYDSHQTAIEEIARIASGEEIDCDLRRLDGFLFLAPGDDPVELDRELDSARRAGFGDAERLPRVPGVAFDSGPCLRFPRQGRFHPLRYLSGLARAIERRGGHVHTGSPVVDLRGGRSTRVLTADGATVWAAAVVVATNSPFHDRLVVHSLQSPWRTYAVGVAIDGHEVDDALYWDTAEPYHYVRRLGGTESDVLVVGGEDHRVGEESDAETRFARLAAWARQRFGGGEIRHRWSGQVLEPVDGLGFIGRDPLGADNVFVVSGDSGHGMTHGVIAGILLTALIVDGGHPWASLYDPRRLPFAAAGDIARTGLHIAARYSEWLLGAPDELSSADDLPRDRGGILRRLGRPVAAYRDESGVLHLRSAVCPHLGCLVHWNDGEKTWDCPCHGSRFTATGNVIHGPAHRGLAPARL